MGTSGSYSGSGGKFGDKVRDDLTDWLNSPPPSDSPPPPPPNDQPPNNPHEDNTPPEPNRPDTRPPKLNPNVLLPIVQLLRPRTAGGGGSDGPGGGGGSGGNRSGGGPARTAAASAGTAGRAASAAYAYRTGDAATLDRLGLDYAELTALGDPFEITRRIVDAACGRPDSTMEDHEQRLVAFDVADWVLTENPDGQPPEPEAIVRHTIAVIIAETVLTETGALISSGNHSGVAVQEIRDAAEALAAREQFPPNGLSDADFASSIERGIEALRTIVEGTS